MRSSVVILKKIMLPCVAVCLCTGWSARERAEMYGAKASVEVHVVDEEGEVVSNALVKVYFGMSIREGKEVKGKTDSRGVFPAQGKTTGEIYINVEYVGYYNSTRHLKFFDESTADVKKGKWHPYGRRERIILRRIGNPVPLLRYGDGLVIPKTNTWFGFDMEMKDFVAPHGKGTEADFEVLMQWDGKPPVSSQFDSLSVRFPGKGSGVYKVQRYDESDFKWVHQANETGYVPTELHFSKRRVNGVYEKNEFDKRYPLVCRSRCRFDADGRLISANYSLLTNLGGGASWEKKVLFGVSYFFNCKPNDRSLEEQNIYNTPNFGTIGGVK